MRRALPLIGILTLGTACSGNDAPPEPSQSDAAQVQAEDAALPEAGPSDRGDGSAEAAELDAGDANAGDLDAAATLDAAVTFDASPDGALADAELSGDSGGQCVAGPLAFGAATAELLVVFDASGSTRQVAQYDCTNVSMGGVTQVACAALGIDCSLPPHAGGPNCGGLPIDRFGATASVVNTIAAQLEKRVPIGLLVFPGAPTQPPQMCAPGDELVVPRLESAAELAAKLAVTKPDGNSPLAPTLRRALSRIKTRAGSATGETRRSLVLLVTDGAPTCANTSTASLSDALLAIDELTAAHVPTLVLAHEDRLPLADQQALTTMAVRGGGSRYWRTEQVDALSAELDRAARAPSCWFELKDALAASSTISVTLDGITLVKDSPGGYTLNERRFTLQGQACELISGAGQHTLSVQQSCAGQP